MDKDRKSICDIISQMLDTPDRNGIYKTTSAFDQLESLVHNARVEAIGWTHADACVHLDRGQDYRQVEVPGILDRAIVDLCCSSDPDGC